MSQTVLLEPLLRTDPMLPRQAVVRAIKPEAYGITTFSLEYSEPDAPVGFSPGQFNMIHLPGIGEVAISIASDPVVPHVMEHTIRYAGSVTRAFSRVKVGDTVGMRGPYGNPWPMELAKGKDLMIVSGGIGLAPLRPVILDVLHRRGEFGRVILLYGGRTPQDLLYTDEFERWQEGGMELFVSVDRADETWKGQVGVIPMAFYRIRLDYRNTIVFSCGPEIMMRFVIYEAMARRVPKDSIYVSMERNMKCAIGFCGHCQVGPSFICKQGPIFRFSAIESFFGKEEF
ncbi:MAG TPA: FAD/NAD(P)-binding protein [Terracidiphilus sp.]|nr:FAD/NAD(P)-binding protein [Terracidiphilus sp.]